MDVKEAYDTIVGIEAAFETARFETNMRDVGRVNLWPIVRKSLWAEALRWPSADNASRQSRQGLGKQIGAKGRMLLRALNACPHITTSIPSNTCTLFVSRPAYLQSTRNGHLEDRVVDPLIMLLSPSARPAKLYLTPWLGDGPLAFPAKWLLPRRQSASWPTSLTDDVYSIADLAGLPRDRFLRMNEAALDLFVGWYARGKEMFSKCPKLKHIYLTSWYFPDTMGLTAAARQSGITVTEVQHGKQGRFQPMYSGWTSIPEGKTGYLMMPDRFWCWGEPSRQHILEAQPHRQTHLPFVGGYPWIDHYRTHYPKDQASCQTAADEIHIVFSLQRQDALNPIPIPDGFIDLLNDNQQNLHITFKPHPNDAGAEAYLNSRLEGVAKNRFTILSGQTNLYDLFETATHHVTAFSSCCYEATSFGLPTLLFGTSAARNYQHEIDEGQFSWTSGDRRHIQAWLEQTTKESFARQQRFTPYIVSSLDIAATRLRDASTGQ